jgi:hypothetical protein
LQTEDEQEVTPIIETGKEVPSWSDEVPHLLAPASNGRDRLTKPRAVPDINRAAEIISRIGVLFKKGAQRELVDVGRCK